MYLNPKHLDASLAELERCVANGPMVGVKLWVAQRCNDPSLDPIIRRAAELKAVIFQHTWFKTAGNFPGESTPDELAEVAPPFPGGAHHLRPHRRQLGTRHPRHSRLKNALR